MSEEKETKKEKEMIHKRVHERLKKSGWKIATVALLALLIISIFTGGFKDFFMLNLGKQKAAEEAVSYINTNLLQAGAKATLDDIIDEGSLYKLNIKVGTLDFESYVTKDGKYLFPQGIDMTEKVEELPAEKETPAVQKEIPKLTSPKTELFVFSYCPAGISALDAFAPVANLFKQEANFRVRFFSSMHGEHELQQNKIQECIQETQPEKYWDYASDFYEKIYSVCGPSRDIQCDKEKSIALMTEKGINSEKVLQCVKERGEELYSKDGDEASKFGLSASPSLVINDISLGPSFDRSSEGVKKLVCSAFNEQPEDCEKSLSQQTKSSGNC